MKIANVKANERFDQTEFSDEVTDGRALSIYSACTCPNCSRKIGFQKSDFLNMQHPSRTNLSTEVAARFDAFAREHFPDLRGFLDWNCPGCRLAARVYVRFVLLGKGMLHIFLEPVIETMPSEQ